MYKDRIVFKSNTKATYKIREYNYIKEYYGIDNCDPPPEKPSNLTDYE